jgi:hypothetical protein
MVKPFAGLPISTLVLVCPAAFVGESVRFRSGAVLNPVMFSETVAPCTGFPEAPVTVTARPSVPEQLPESVAVTLSPPVVLPPVPVVVPLPEVVVVPVLEATGGVIPAPGGAIASAPQ